MPCFCIDCSNGHNEIQSKCEYFSEIHSNHEYLNIIIKKTEDAMNG